MDNKKKQDKEMEQDEALKKILDNYRYMNRMLVEELEIASKHGTLTGGYREQTWMDLFRRIIPKKYSLAQGVMIIDSDGRISKEVDIAVYDEQYTPYIFQYNALKFIPIEAVAVVIECKSTKWCEEHVKKWSDAIKNLVPKSSGIARMVGGYTCGITNTTQKKTRPIKILTAIKSIKKDKTIVELKDTYKDYFDFIIVEKTCKDNSSKTLEVIVKNEDKSLGWWGQELNKVGMKKEKADKLELHCLSINKKSGKNDYPELELDEDNCSSVTLEKLKIKNNPLLSLNFQLNQLLMLLNNPMLFPHYAYAREFNAIVEKYEKKNTEEC